MAAVLEDAGVDSYDPSNSLGGMLSWNLAYERPDLVQSMMLMAPAGYAWDSITQPYVEGMAPWYVGTILNLRLGVSRESREDAANDSFYNKEVLPSNWFSHCVDAGYAFMNLPDRIHWQRTMILSQEMADTVRIQQLTQPTMILWGEEDEVLPFAHRSRFMRDLQEGYLVEMPLQDMFLMKKTLVLSLTYCTISIIDSNLPYRMNLIGFKALTDSLYNQRFLNKCMSHPYAVSIPTDGERH